MYKGFRVLIAFLKCQTVRSLQLPEWCPFALFVVGSL